MFVSAQESFLRQIVGQSEVGAGELAQETSHARLMPTHQFAESMLVFIDKNTSDEVRIG
jgi:hypothetical protein